MDILKMLDSKKSLIGLIGHGASGLGGACAELGIACTKSGAFPRTINNALERGLIFDSYNIEDMVKKLVATGITAADSEQVLRQVIRPDMHFGLNDIKLSMDKLCIDDWGFEDEMRDIRKISSTKNGFNDNEILKRRKKNREAKKSRHKNRCK